MKKFFRYALLLSAIAWIGVSCSDDDTTGGGGSGSQPSIDIEDVTAESDPVTTIKVTITPKNASECAYLCYRSDEGERSAEDILASGTPVETALTTTVTVENLDYDTEYIFAVAVKGKGDKARTAIASFRRATGTNPIASSNANTYIVSEAGTFEFETKKVSGAAIENIASADWIWATKQSDTDTDQEIISDVSYDNGKIEFTVSGKRGNAVIAAFDASQNIVWEWLIWCTEQPEEMKYESGAIFLDRAIGATSADPDDDATYATWGSILYQWGRLAPFFSGYVDEWGTEQLFDEARKWTVINPAHNLLWNTEYRTASVAEAIANPTTYYASEEEGFVWNDEKSRTLWGKEKTDYDPCPPGYRIPASAEWGNLVDELDIEYTVRGTYTYDGNSAHFPKQNNGRNCDTGENIVGFPGFTYWNCDEILYDAMGFVEAGLLTEEEAIARGFASYQLSRTACNYMEGAVRGGSKMPANASFAFSIRCVKIQ